MSMWIIKFLCWINLLFFVDNLSAQPLFPQGTEKVKWNLTLTRGKMTFTGICVVKQTEEGMVGSVVNEFGIHAFDMIGKRGRLKIKHMMPLMDKWYIQKILQNDLRILTFANETDLGKKRVLEISDSHILLENKKYNIKYLFERIKQDDIP